MLHRRLHRRVLGACAAVLTAGALGLAGPAGTAAAQKAAPPSSQARATDVSPQLLHAMQRDLDLSVEQAKQRLINEDRAAVTAGELRVALDESFAGSWVRGETAQALTVATTDSGEVDQITDRGARARVVQYSLAELDAAKAALDRLARGDTPEHTPVYYVDVATNQVVLLSSKPAATRQFVAEAGVDADAARVKRSSVQPRPYYDLRGGDAYYIGGGTRCSIGFSVTKGGGQGGFVSAGHCGDRGQSTSGVNRARQGTFRGSSFPGNDYSWIATNSSWTPRPLVNGYGRPDRVVRGSTVAQRGASVCRSGSTTGWHCGTILQRNTSVTYPQGTISGVTRTNVCAEPGDSGGSFISGNQAQGMTSGGSGDCTRGGITFFQPVNEALQRYGLTLVTEGSQPPEDPEDPEDPGEPGGTWAAGTVYQIGDTVTYDGVTYRCIQSHQALPGWEPPSTPSLWQRV